MTVTASVNSCFQQNFHTVTRLLILAWRGNINGTEVCWTSCVIYLSTRGNMDRGVALVLLLFLPPLIAAVILWKPLDWDLRLLLPALFTGIMRLDSAGGALEVFLKLYISTEETELANGGRLAFRLPLPLLVLALLELLNSFSSSFSRLALR